MGRDVPGKEHATPRKSQAFSVGHPRQFAPRIHARGFFLMALSTAPRDFCPLVRFRRLL
jgi:hypothetical protein